MPSNKTENTNKNDTTNPNQCVTVGTVSDDGKVSINIGSGSSHIDDNNEKEVKGLGNDGGNSNNDLNQTTSHLNNNIVVEFQTEDSEYNTLYNKLKGNQKRQADKLISDIDKPLKERIIWNSSNTSPGHCNHNSIHI
jgi:hypothetical protein